MMSYSALNGLSIAKQSQLSENIDLLLANMLAPMSKGIDPIGAMI